MEYAVARAPEVVMAVDWTNGGAQLSITYVNDAFTRTLGYTWEEAIDQSPTMLCGPSTDRDVLKKGLEKVLRDGSAIFDVIHYRKDGTPIWLEVGIIPVTDANGAITATLSFARELKDLKPRTYAAPFS
jgi:PAS domain S-box-containing protein